MCCAHGERGCAEARTASLAARRRTTARARAASARRTSVLARPSTQGGLYQRRHSLPVHPFAGRPARARQRLGGAEQMPTGRPRARACRQAQTGLVALAPLHDGPTFWGAGWVQLWKPCGVDARPGPAGPSRAHGPHAGGCAILERPRRQTSVTRLAPRAPRAGWILDGRHAPMRPRPPAAAGQRPPSAAGPLGLAHQGGRRAAGRA
jgi:hypothetical protein